MVLVVKQVLRQAVVGLAVLVALTVVVGIAYPAVVWGVARIAPGGPEGSRVTDRAGCEVGSALLGIDPRPARGAPDPYLHARVVGSDDDPFAPGDASASAASQQGPSSEKLARWIQTRRADIAAREGVSPDRVPVDAVTGSGSGLDPDISPAYAAVQVPRIARVTGKTQDQVRAVIAANTDGRQLGFLGQPTVNVLGVNRGLGLTAGRCG
ncbi:potassium-transporting ATPase subunit C [Williamsia serinedens]|uniref:Potassium-transporting ATPase KdpC subunit n=1 Tax=Williamsia serinedens TaxID=391736 RepID=A0ABT1GVD9_9NOCA|nr:potassium-transporting ATPase subunit C [Williamsia serinedens]MCP2158939.1 K+-transporting ATPase ATPase C chain [Williamsia serinedens]